MKNLLKIAIIGATGYVGLELVKILSLHPRVRIMHLCSKKHNGMSIRNFDKKINSKNLPKLTRIQNINWKNVDIIFSALPNGEAHSIAKKINHKIKLIDLSADFRLRNFVNYEKFYGIKHNCKNLIKKSIYAISEFNKKEMRDYNIISCPGCYPTSILLPLIPLVKKKLINTGNIIADSKSGYSGAGKKINRKFSFKNIYNSVSAYGVGKHRHMLEIDQELSKIYKKKVKVFFTPHLLPMFRGILSTIYIELNKDVSAKKIYKFLKKYHSKNFFVKIAKFNSHIGTGEVMNTNLCKISVCKDRVKNKAIIISVIDNLIKGASGQAVQNMNLCYGFRETTGLK